MMKRLFLTVPALMIGLTMPAAAQQSSNLHYYMIEFEWTDAAVKSLIDNPQDRTAIVRKLYESYGGKLDHYFMVPGTSGGMIIAEFPDNVTVEATTMETLATGALAKVKYTPLMTTEEARLAMQRVKDSKSGYTPPATTGSTTPPTK